MFMTNEQSAELSQPGVGSLDNPAPFVASHFPPIFISPLACCSSCKARSARCRAASISRAVDRSRNPRSAITRFGFCRGRPFGLGTRTSLSVASASVTSAGEALSSRTPNGTPSPSPSTIHFVPLPRLVLPTASPPFSPGRSCRPETSSSHFSRPSASRAPSKARQASEPDAFVLPLLQPPPAGRTARDTRREEIATPLQSAESTECPQNRPDSMPTAVPGCPSCAVGFREQRLDQLPLLIGQQLLPLLHDRSSTVRPASGISTCLEAEPIYETRSR